MTTAKRRWQEATWATTTELAHEFGLAEKLIRRRVHSGELVPTYAGPGLGRWSREDFAAQIAGAGRARSMHLADGIEMWSGDDWVMHAQPEHSISLMVGPGLGRLIMPAVYARALSAALSAAAGVAETRHPDCTCRDLMRNGRIEMIVPVPSCPVHHGATP